MFSAGAPVQWLSMLTRTPSPLQYSSCCSSCCLCSCRTHSFPDQHLIHSPTLQRGCFIHLHTTHILLSYSASHPGILGHLNDFFNFFFWRGGGKKRERNINVWLLLVPPQLGPGPQPGRVPWPGIEPATLGFTDLRSIHWATPARAKWFFKNVHTLKFTLWEMEMSWFPRYSILQNSFTALRRKSPMLHLFNSTPPHPWQSVCFYFLCKFAFSRMSYNWNHTVRGFLNWLLSFSNTPTCVISRLDDFLLLLNNSPL